MCSERTKIWFISFVLVLTAKHGESGLPIVINAGSAIQQNHQQQQDVNGYNGAVAKGIANYEGDQGFNHDLHNLHKAMSNSGRYGEHRGVVQNSLNQNQFNRDTVQQNGGGLVTDLENKRAHKKGHHNSGFRNTYHKDETGSNSSFYDDGGDEGDEYVRKSQRGQFGDTMQGNVRGSNLHATNYGNQGAEQGSYNNGQHVNSDAGRQGQFNRNQYIDDREQANRANAAKAYGEAGRFDQEQYNAVKPVYPVLPAPHPLPHPPAVPPVLVHHPLPVQEAPVAPPIVPLPPPQYQQFPKRQITIYEDPRYVPQNTPYRQYDNYGDQGDYVELDVRPPPPRRPPPYDDYYY